MKPKDLVQYLEFTIQNKFTTLIAGAPGIGKSDIVLQVCQKLGADLILMHPVISDPTDFKGLPFSTNGHANFLPYGDLEKLIRADKLTVCFLDDLGQSSVAVQAACMQLLLARQIGEHKVSDHVVFIAATNRKEDKAGVTGLLEPVKSRFRAGIITLEVDTDDWLDWAFENDMPVELISFVRMRPDLLHNFESTRDLTNSTSPRTIASVGLMQINGLPEKFYFEAFEGIAGKAFASEYTAFLKMWKDLPDVEEIAKNPDRVKVPTDASVRYALTGALSYMSNTSNIKNILKYLDKLPKEYAVATVKNIQSLVRNGKKETEVFENQAYTDWSLNNHHVFVS